MPSPRSSATTDQPNAARVPSETSVSMVAVPWRRLVAAARCSGHAPQRTAGAASTSAPHSQPGNCRAGTMDRAITGTASAVTMTKRSRNALTGSGAAGGVATGSAAV